MKYLISIFLLIALFVFSLNLVKANEGRIVLKDGNRACEGISYWEADSYKIAGRCSGFAYPYNGELDRYVLWVKAEDGVITKISEIENGIMEGRARTKFTNIFITAENRTYSKNPSGPTVLSADIQKFEFSEPKNPAPVENSDPSPTPLVGLATPAPRFGNLFSRGGVTFLIVFGLIVLVIVFLMRGK